jgi:hypothetical protein
MSPLQSAAGIELQSLPFLAGLSAASVSIRRIRHGLQQIACFLSSMSLGRRQRLSDEIEAQLVVMDVPARRRPRLKYVSNKNPGMKVGPSGAAIPDFPETREFSALCDRAHRWPSFMPKPGYALARVLCRGICAVHFEPPVSVSNQLEDTALTEPTDTVE